MTIPVSHISTMTRWGGVEQLLVDLLTQASPSRFSHFLLTTSSHPDVIDPVRQAGVTMFQPQRRFRYSPGAINQMVQWLRSQQIQVVHGYNTPAGVWAGLAASLARTPVFIAGEHGTWTVTGPMALLTYWTYRRAQQVIVNSKATQFMVCQRFGLPSDKVQVVYNAIPEIPMANKNDPNPFCLKKELIIGSVGRLDQLKHYITLIEAAAIVLRHTSQVRFVLVGGGDEMPVLLRRIHQLGIQEKFILTGWQANARNLMQYFDIFVSTSLRESFGNVLVEASMVGKPVVAPHVDGIPEAVLHGKTGILIKPTVPINDKDIIKRLPRQLVIDGQLAQPKSLDPQQLAETILSLVDNSDARYRLGKAGQERARSMFTLARYQRELEQVYKNCLGETG